MVGNGIPKLVERFSPENARTPEQLAATLAEFTARYDAHKEDKTAPYPGIPELLDELRTKGVPCAVFSNKADPLCGKIIAHYFGTGRFAAVRGSRPGVPTKPDPAGLYALMDEIGADRSATLFAVSYTHLDVYKRQGHYYEIEIYPHPLAAALRSAGLQHSGRLQRLNRQQFRSAKLCQQLDVYKRQSVSCHRYGGTYDSNQNARVP